MTKLTKTSHDSETLAFNQQVITACAFIHHNFDGVNKLFMPKRAITKKFLPGVFELPGGHIDFAEELKFGLAREILEEFELKINIGDCFAAFTYVNEIKGSHSVEIVYFATLKNSKYNEIKINPEDHCEYIWITKNEITLITDNNKQDDDKEVEIIKKGFDILENPGAIDIG
jgi:8-oxo-dGTP diphosphatase